MRLRWWANRHRAIGGLALAMALAGSAVVAGANLLVIRGGRNDAPADAPVALVLGAGLNVDGSPSVMLADRLAVAADLYRSGRVRTVLASGDHGTVGHDEAGAMRRGLVALGVPDEHVFTDHAGFDTWASAVRARKVFRADRVVVVTQRFHLARAVWLARRAGLEADGVAADRHPYGTKGRRAGVREVVARVKAVVDVALDRQPVLGPTIDLAGDGRATVG